MTPHESELRSVLTRDAESIDATGDFAEAAMTLERQRRRRRRTLAGTAVATATALAVGIPLALSERGPGGAIPAGTSSPTPTSSSPTASPEPTPSVGQATASREAYAVGNVLHIGDRVVRLPRGTIVEQFAVLEGGGVVVASHVGENPWVSAILDATGRQLTKLPDGVDDWRVSRDGTKVFYADNGRTFVVDARGKALNSLETDKSGVALIGDRLYFGGPSGEGETGLVWNHVTGVTQAAPGHIAAVSDDERLAALYWMPPSDDPTSGCWAVVDLKKAGTPKLHGDHCGTASKPNRFQPLTFSPDGTQLLGSNNIDGGHWFASSLVTVTDGSVIFGHDGTDESKIVSGWGMRWSDDGATVLFSRNTSSPLSPVTGNDLVRCTVALSCTEVAPNKSMTNRLFPHYILPR
ncbi:hypothetical protein N802_05210 [Knoellia sinensis KCTC 19936]|uniref:WD40 repeat domain-containing protein n=1 Tax=Knoellia sinensis KCTC 19936 TaxID=1385520 RepID=A0A0A0J2X1_9MICO|nr:hypothetical protein [Knoellia sinensis]KGN31004.1 hypothetical protein N802_05210 [Knoellia sinensis KCTC 19936]